jgi:hypothetical protein
MVFSSFLDVCDAADDARVPLRASDSMRISTTSFPYPRARASTTRVWALAIDPSKAPLRSRPTPTPRIVLGATRVRRNVEIG